MQDEFYMARALKLAQRGRFTTHPNPNVGCVIVNNDTADIRVRVSGETSTLRQFERSRHVKLILHGLVL